jgi:hypothetical protein
VYECAADVAPLFLFSNPRTLKSRVPYSGKAYVCGLTGGLGHALDVERVDGKIGMSWMLALEKLANLGRKWEGLGAWKSEGQGRNIGPRIKSICQGSTLILSYAKGVLIQHLRNSFSWFS